MNSKYYILSAFHSEKYELYAQVNEVGILVVAQIKELRQGITDMLGIGKQKQEIIERIEKLQKQNVIVLVEESVTYFGVGATNRLLTDTYAGRLARDVYFDHFLNLYSSGVLYLPEEFRHQIPREGSHYEVVVDDKGKVSYRFRNEIRGEFRAILLLVSAYVKRPFDLAAVNDMFKSDNIFIKEEDTLVETLLKPKSDWNAETRKALRKIEERLLNQL